MIIDTNAYDVSYEEISQSVETLSSEDVQIMDPRKIKKFGKNISEAIEDGGKLYNNRFLMENVLIR